MYRHALRHVERFWQVSWCGILHTGSISCLLYQLYCWKHVILSEKRFISNLVGIFIDGSFSRPALSKQCFLRNFFDIFFLVSISVLKLVQHCKTVFNNHNTLSLRKMIMRRRVAIHLSRCSAWTMNLDFKKISDTRCSKLDRTPV